MILTITLAVVLIVTEWRHSRREQTLQASLELVERRHSAHMAKVIEQKNPDLSQLIALVDRQMQRIQAPVQAVADHSMAQVMVSPPAIGFDDDEAFNEAQRMSKEDLADFLMEQHVAA